MAAVEEGRCFWWCGGREKGKETTSLKEGMSQASVTSSHRVEEGWWGRKKLQRAKKGTGEWRINERIGRTTTRWLRRSTHYDNQGWVSLKGSLEFQDALEHI